MAYNPKKHNRRSIRLGGYNYSGPGIYFVTLCTHERQCLFGEIKDSPYGHKMELNEGGEIARQYWQEIPKHFPNIKLGEFIIMPNHIHGILIICDNENNLDAGANDHSPHHPYKNQKNEGAKFRSPAKTVGSVIRGFKIGVTKWFPKNTDIHTVWQRNYYDHIVRNYEELRYIADYIIQNPSNWNEDKFHTK